MDTDTDDTLQVQTVPAKEGLGQTGSSMSRAYTPDAGSCVAAQGLKPARSGSFLHGMN